MRNKTLVLAVAAALMSSGTAFAQRVGPGVDPEGPSNGNPEGLQALPGFTCSGQGGTNCSVAFSGPVVTSTFDISGCGAISDVDVGLDISHTWVGDVIATVRSPANTSVTIVDRPGDPAVVEGCSGDDIFAVLDDSAAAPVEDECAGAPPVINGFFSPNNLLQAFAGESADGTWSLDVSDAVPAFDSGTLNDWSVDVFTSTCGTPGGEEGVARFAVEKFFDDGNPGAVDVNLSCNTGLPLEQTTSISEGDGVVFVVTDFAAGEMTCTVSESSGVGGYSVEYFDGSSTSDEGCTFPLVDFETTHSCDITNSLQEVEVEVTKVWIDENPQFNAVNLADAEWECGNVAFGTDEGSLEFFGNPGEDSFFVFPSWDGGTNCAITEVSIPDGGVEVDDSDCDSVVVFPGVGGACTIFNTRLFEGIPTLSQYGLGLLAMLMLGLGFVAYRRIV